MANKRRRRPNSRDKRRQRRMFLETLERRLLLAADLDFGDAPDLGPGFGPGDYATLPSDNGPSHVVSPSLSIGTRTDAESDPQPDALAGGDDRGAGYVDDEDGIRNPALDLTFTVTSNPTVSVLVSNTTGEPAVLTGWVDFNGDGVFDDANERKSVLIGGEESDGEDADNGLNPGFYLDHVVELQFEPLLTSFHGTTYARFRLGLAEDEAARSSTGPAGIGEVEDYVATIHRPSTGMVDELQYYQTDALYEADRNKFTTPFVSDKYAFDYEFGKSVVALGDLDGNGVQDLAVAAPGANMNGSDTGAVHVFFMEDDGSYSKRTILGPDVGFGESEENGGHWLRLVSLGDLDDDGINELAVSYGSQDSISLSALYLDGEGNAKSVKTIASGVGIPVGYLGDLDDDGTRELAVKSPFVEDRDTFQILSLNQS